MQAKRMKYSNTLTRIEAAQLIEDFLNGTSAYPGRWNEFVATNQKDPGISAFRKRCYQLDPLVNLPGDQDQGAVAELRSMIERLRKVDLPCEWSQADWHS
jgi:hypothetical protein